jgi:hypothetical protein
VKIFLAGNIAKKIPQDYLTYRAPYVLQTFYDMQYWDDELIKKAVSSPKMFLCDSGAFSFMNSGKVVDWKQYIDSYCAFINRNNISNFFELDLDTVIGVENTKKITRYIEKKTQKQVIPVFHACRGMKSYRQMCQQYNYVAIGASAITAECKWVKNKDVLRQMVDIAHQYGSKVHGLGYTRLSNINKTDVEFDSVDSSACLSGGRFATVYKFTGTRLISTNIKGKSKGYKELNAHNIQEWIKMANYKDGEK